MKRPATAHSKIKLQMYIQQTFYTLFFDTDILYSIFYKNSSFL